MKSQNNRTHSIHTEQQFFLLSESLQDFDPSCDGLDVARVLLQCTGAVVQYTVLVAGLHAAIKAHSHSHELKVGPFQTSTHCYLVTFICSSCSLRTHTHTHTHTR